MTDRPTLYVCHGDEGGPPGHPCSRVQKAMHAKGIEYDKVIAGSDPSLGRRPASDGQLNSVRAELRAHHLVAKAAARRLAAGQAKRSSGPRRDSCRTRSCKTSTMAARSSVRSWFGIWDEPAT